MFFYENEELPIFHLRLVGEIRLCKCFKKSLDEHIMKIPVTSGKDFAKIQHLN